MSGADLCLFEAEKWEKSGIQSTVWGSWVSFQFFVPSSRLSLVDRMAANFPGANHEQSIAGKENLCDFGGTAAFVSFGVAVPEIDFGGGFLVFTCGHPAGELGRTTCADGGKFVGYSARSAAVA